MSFPTAVTILQGFTKRRAIVVGIVALALAALFAYDSLVETLPMPRSDTLMPRRSMMPGGMAECRLSGI